MALPSRKWVTIEQYLQIDQSSTEQRYEYIDGHIRLLAGGTPDHAKISANCIITIGSLLADSPCSVYTSDARVQVSATRFVYPNVTISCDDQDALRGDTIQHPCVVIEVLSPTTEAHDRGRKFTESERESPRHSCLILTHIFLRERAKRIEMAEMTTNSSILLGLPSRLAHSICKM